VGVLDDINTDIWPGVDPTEKALPVGVHRNSPAEEAEVLHALMQLDARDLTPWECACGSERPKWPGDATPVPTRISQREPWCPYCGRKYEQELLVYPEEPQAS
jgi:hypothetical protein